jgi:nucleoid-associated protein YgaU
MISRSGWSAGLVREWWHLRKGRGCVLLILIAALVPVAGRAQDVAEAARQEKARKAAQGARQSHVYTNDDLQKAEILSRQESAAVAGRKKNPDIAPESASAATPGAEPALHTPAMDAGEKVVASESLGDVARRYRREKETKQAERASANLPSSQFHLEVTTPVLAEIAPRGAWLRSSAPSSLPVARSMQPRNSGVPAKRDPFVRPELGPLGTANRPAAMKESRPVANPGTQPAGHGTDVVGGMTQVRNAAAMIASERRLLAQPNPGLVLAPGVDGMVVVRAGDSLWSLSRRYSGAGARWRVWLAANPGIQERRLRPGMKLAPPLRNYAALLPNSSASPLRRQAKGGRYKIERLAGVSNTSRDGSAAEKIAVRAGDSFWKIAVARYGDGRLWRCIAHANAEWRNVEKIYPGQTLNLSVTCSH